MYRKRFYCEINTIPIKISKLFAKQIYNLRIPEIRLICTTIINSAYIYFYPCDRTNQ